MESNLVARIFPKRFFLFTLLIVLIFAESKAQKKLIDGKEFSAYSPGAFKPKHGLYYSLYVSPVYTIDPLGLGGKSTYALSVGARINLWESKSHDLKGLKIKGWYIGGGYEYYPQQFDMAYFSIWLRVKTFIPLVGKIDKIYAFDGTYRGLMTRYCIGVEVKKLSLMLSGSTFGPINGEDQPVSYSEYTTAGSILLIIPLYTRD
jgi:hypothetical protein